MLEASINAALAAVADRSGAIDVVVNGNPGLAAAVGHRVSAQGRTRIASGSLRVWRVASGDKAHAWNQYVHKIWPGSELAYFMDGYAEVNPDALRLIADGLARSPSAWAASGVPTLGRSAAKLRAAMLEGGGLHGNLYAVRGEVLVALRERGFRLPLGLYRTDPTLGAALCFSLDPAANDWDVRRILVQPDASWTFRPSKWWRLADLRSSLKRLARQAQGTLENRAIRERFAVRRSPPQDLPRTAAKLVEEWMTASPEEARSLLRARPLCRYAARQLARPRDWSKTTLAPELVAVNP